MENFSGHLIFSIRKDEYCKCLVGGGGGGERKQFSSLVLPGELSGVDNCQTQ